MDRWKAFPHLVREGFFQNLRLMRQRNGGKDVYIQWIGPDGSLKAQDQGEDEARLVVNGEYEEGDRLTVESTEDAVYAGCRWRMP